MLQMKKEMENMWEYKVGNNTNIANYVSLWKTRPVLFEMNWWVPSF